jgi:hypothetical protein
MSTAKGRMVLPLALAVGAMGLMVFMTATAGATHPRPAGASPLRVSLVPAYKPCTAANRTHGPPLAFPSCNPPEPGSNFLTVGTPDANGAPAKSLGFFKVAVRTNPGPPAESQIVITSRITDVRCKAGTSTCGNANTTGGPDYTGDLQANATIRMTDHYNATSPGGGSDPATVVDIPFPVNMPCISTSDPEVGGLCDLAFAPQPLTPVPNDTWFNGKRVVVEMTQFEVSDGGSDGVVSTTPNTVFMRQGIFIP